MAKAVGSGASELFISTMPPVPLSRWVCTLVMCPGMPPSCPTKVRSPTRTTKKPSPIPAFHRSGSIRTWGWHISSTVSGERIDGSGSATKADQRARSRAVLASPPQGAIARVSMSGSRRGTSWNGGTKYPSACGPPSKPTVVRVRPSGSSRRTRSDSAQGRPSRVATSRPRTAYTMLE